MLGTFTHILRSDGFRGLYNGVRFLAALSLTACILLSKLITRLQSTALRLAPPPNNIFHNSLRHLRRNEIPLPVSSLPSHPRSDGIHVWISWWHCRQPRRRNQCSHATRPCPPSLATPQLQKCSRRPDPHDAGRRPALAVSRSMAQQSPRSADDGFAACVVRFSQDAAY